jgi:ABC-2 type transport system permease protein
MRALLGHHWRRHRVMLFVLALALFAFEWLITRIAPEAAQTQLFQGILQLIPPTLVNMLGELTANFNARGMIGFGYVHPFALLMMGAWAVRVTAGALAGEVGTRTMDLIAARPVSRGALVRAALVALLAGLALLAASAWAGTAVGLATRPVLAIAPWPYAAIAFVLWLFFAAFGAVSLLVSALRRHSGPAIAVGAGIIAVSFALNFAARSWQPIAWTRPLSLFAYYRPERIHDAGVLTSDTAVLLGVAVAAAALAFAAFARRDL